MATFVFFAADEHARRADCRNTIVASGADLSAARAAAERLIGEPDALAGFAVVELDDAVPPFVVEGHIPVGRRDQSTFPSLTRGGNWIG